MLWGFNIVLLICLIYSLFDQMLLKCLTCNNLLNIQYSLNAGVPQSLILRPTLLIVQINDLSDKNKPLSR